MSLEEFFALEQHCFHFYVFVTVITTYDTEDRRCLHMFYLVIDGYKQRMEELKEHIASVLSLILMS